MRTYYKRHLPHYQPKYATFHVVFRLAGSLPKVVVEQLRKERELLRTHPNEELLRKGGRGYFKRFDSLLNGSSTGPHWLRRPEIAEIVKEAIHYRDGKVYDLIAYSIMPNHVHMVVDLSMEDSLSGRVKEDNAVRRIADPTIEKSITGEASGRRDDVPVRRADCPTNKYPLTEILRKLKWNTALRANRALHRTGPFWQDESYDHIIRDDAELERTIWYVLQNPVQAGLASSWDQWVWNYCKWSLE